MCPFDDMIWAHSKLSEKASVCPRHLSFSDPTVLIPVTGQQANLDSTDLLCNPALFPLQIGGIRQLTMVSIIQILLNYQHATLQSTDVGAVLASWVQVLSSPAHLLWTVAFTCQSYG